MTKKKVPPHHTNSGRQEIQSRDIKICTTTTQVEAFSLSVFGMETFEDKSEKMEVIIQEYKDTRNMLMESNQLGLSIMCNVS